MLQPQQPETLSLEEQLPRVVGRVLRIEELRWGRPNDGYRLRLTGELILDSQIAYDQLEQALRPYGITPMFRLEEGRHVVYLVDGVNQTTPSSPWPNLALFLFTLISVLIAGTLYGYEGTLPSGLLPTFRRLFANLNQGWPFALSMLSILLAHEFGHYLAARYHNTAVTLPYFIPFPFSPFGTMGAFIRLKEPPRNKRVLLDVGVAGPLAGMVVAIPVLLYGLATSEVHTLPATLPPGQGFEGNSILYLLSKFLVTGQWLPHPASYGNLPPLVYWLRYFFTGQPLPLGGTDIILNSVAWAGWAGMLVTALNLIPAGQLDGGHLIYVLVGRKADLLRPWILTTLALLGLVWSGWWLWAFLILFLGGRHAEPLDQITPLDKRRRKIAILGLVIFILVFTPVPLLVTG